MIGERLIITRSHKLLAKKLADKLLPQIKKTRGKYVITIAGESGSGKSGMAFMLASLFNLQNVKTVLIQQDDYFKYPPKTNEKRRLKDIGLVGISEVKLKLIQEHIKEFRNSKTIKFEKPLVFFEEDKIRKEIIICKGIKILIVEGTYVSLLKDVDKRIFFTSDYRETLKARQKRNREKIDKFNREILRIEHKIIAPHKDKANIIIKGYASVSRKK